MKLISAVIAALLVSALAAVFYFRAKAPPAPRVWSASEALVEAGPVLFSDDYTDESLMEALDSSLQYFERVQADSPVTVGPDQVPADRIKASLVEIKQKISEFGLGKDFYAYLSENFRFYKSAASSVLFTGYYLPLLRGSYFKSERFSYPLYRRPDDLYQVELSSFPFFEQFPGMPEATRGRLAGNNRIVPYYSRAEIDFGQKLAGLGLEILWVDSAVEAFFLHIQGSGIIELEDGSRILAGYADQNGHPYRAIGKVLMERGALPEGAISMQMIREYLTANPGQMQEVLSANPSYIFFRAGGTDPIGSIGAPLTAYRSIATDSRLFPKGAPALIKTKKPIFDENLNITGWREFSRLALNQDTGGAIRGPGRVDIFMGFGAEAEAAAGHMRQEGELYFLVKRQTSPASRP